MNDAQNAYTLFHNEFTCMYDTHFPIKECSMVYKTRKPWLSEGMKKQIKIKNRLYRRHLKTNIPEHLDLYKKFKNKLQGILYKSEKEYYEKLLKENENNLKKSWRILKEVINKKKNAKCCSKFMINNSLCSDKKQISCGFDNFFTNMDPLLLEKFPLMTVTLLYL